MWPGVRPAVFGEMSRGKKYGGKTPVVRVPVERCPAVKWVDTVYNASQRACLIAATGIRPIEIEYLRTP